jgi:hypothetical protein
MRPQEGDGVFDCGVLTGGDEGEVIEELKEGLAMTRIEAPEEGKVAGFSDTGLQRAFM